MLILFLLIWIILNGKINPEITVFGVVIALGIYAFCCKFIGYGFKKDLGYLKKLPMFIAYIAVLVVEIIKANILMVKYIVVKQEYELKPVIFKMRTKLKSKILRVILANSITLTPGTISVSLQDDEIIINAIDEVLAIEDDGDFIFERLLLKLEDE